MPKTKKKKATTGRETVQFHIYRSGWRQWKWFAVIVPNFVAVSADPFSSRIKCAKELSRFLKAIFHARVKIVSD